MLELYLFITTVRKKKDNQYKRQKGSHPIWITPSIKYFCCTTNKKLYGKNTEINLVGQPNF